MPQRIVSLDISDAELKATVVQTSFRDYKIAAFLRQPLNGGADAQLKRFLEQNSEAGDTILSTLPGEKVTWRTFFLPFRDAKRLAQTVPFELENSVPFGLDEVVVDYQVLHRDRAGTTVLAALVQKEDLQHHLDLLQRGGADPKVVGLAPLAALNTLSLVPDLPSTYLFLDFAPHSTTVALYREGELAGLRTVSGQTNGNGDETVVLDAAGIEALVAEVRWTVLAINGAPIDDQLVCYIAGERALIDSVERPLAESLPVNVRRLDRVALRNVAPEMGAQAPAFTPSLGAALREVSPGNTVGINFRRGEFTFHRSQLEMRRALRNVAVLGLVVLSLTVLDMFVKHQALKQQAAAVDEQIQKVLAATLPDIGRQAQPKAALQQETDALRQRVNLLNDTVPVSTSTSLDILRAAAGAVPNKIRIDCEEYAMDPDAVRVRCNTETYESVDTIKEGMLKTGYFSAVEVKDAKVSPKGGGVDFRMNLKLNKDFRPSGGRR
jgi:Tfp pilus assembly PilM family ATPase